MAFGFVPTIGYLACREDSSLESLENVRLEAVDKQYTS